MLWEIQVNGEGMQPKKNQPTRLSRRQRKKKGELQYLPNFPDGFDQADLEAGRKDLVNGMRKRTQKGPLMK